MNRYEQIGEMEMKRILIIDDDHDMLYIMKRWLANNNKYMVKTIDNSSEAANLIKSKSWDLIITDVYLDDIDGLEIARLVKKYNINSKILMITGHINANVSIKALNMHVEGFLLKPLDKNDFLNKITELLNVNLKNKRVLAIGAHPDDVEIGCGGTLLKHSKAGDDICILTLTNGALGGEPNKRSLESRNASNMLNAKLVFGHLVDTKLSQGPDTIKVIERVIKDFKPDVIYTHSNNDSHRDHRNCFKATLVSARKVRNLQCYQSPSTTIDFKPTRFADISEQLNQKLELIKCYVSQYQKCRYLKQSLISATAEYWGRFSTYGMAEPFEVIRSI